MGDFRAYAIARKQHHVVNPLAHQILLNLARHAEPMSRMMSEQDFPEKQ